MRGAGILLAGLYGLAGACIAWAQSPATTPIQTIIEYPIPTSGSQPTGIVAGPDGNLWFTELYASKIGRITPAGVITEFPTPTPGSGPAVIAKGADGNLWFTENYSNKIGKISTSGSITEYPVPSAGSGPYGITGGPDGNVWFTEFNSGNIGRITPEGAIAEYPCVFSDEDGNWCGYAYSITAGPDGNLWYAPSTANQLGLMTTSGVGSSTGYLNNSSLFDPYAITTGPDGNIWFTETSLQFGTITAGGQVLVLGQGGGQIITGPDGHIWVTSERSVGLGTLTSAGTVLYPTSYGAAGIAGGPDGNIWLTQPAANSIAVLLLSGGPPSSAPAISPSSLAFTGFFGGSEPAPQTLTVSAAGATDYTASAALEFNFEGTAPWLTISPSGSLNGSRTITVNANPAGLSSGNNLGWIQLVSGPVTETVMVSLDLSAPASGNVVSAPNSLSFSYTTGGGVPASQPLSIASAAGSTYAVPYTVSTSVTSPSGGTWLTIGAGQSSGTTPASVAVSVNPSGLTTGTYTGAIVITPTGGSALTVPVTFTVSTIPVFSASPTSLSFLYQPGTGTNPTNQAIQVTEQSVVTTTFTATATSTPAGWLSVSPTSGTLNSGSATYAVSVSPAGLTRGTYTGSISITPGVTGAQTTTVSVSLTVTDPVLLVSPSSLTFTYPYTVAPAPQSIQVTAPGNAAIPFSVRADLNGLVSVTPTSGTTPATLTVSPSSAGLQWLPSDTPANIYVWGAASGDPETVVYVGLQITAANISASPASLNFTYQPGGALPQSQSLQVNGAGNAIVPISAVTTANWLFVTSGFGNTPMSPVVSVSPTGLAPGTYTADVEIYIRYNGTQQGPQQIVPVTLTVGSGSTVSASPTSLSFACQTGGSSPGPQSVQVSASGSAAVSFTAAASSTGNWLSATPASGSTPATLAVSVSPAGLGAGTYTGSVVLTAGTSGSPQTVLTVSLTVTTAATVSASPTSLNFAYQSFGSLPASQSLQVSASGNAAVSFAAQSSNSAWLSVTPASGTTPATLVVSVSPASLTAGTYNGAITVNGIGVAVSLTVTGSAPASSPTISAVLNAASYSNGAVSPGEMVSIFGTSIGPANPASLTLDSTGKVSTSIGGVTVSFGGYLAPLTYAGSGQINAVVPYEVAGSASPSVQVTYGGQTSNEISLQLTNTTPAIFTQNSSGTGAGVILNQDYSPNTQANPAAPGSVVQIYMTGEGLTTPAQATGAVTPVNASGVGPLTPAPQGSITVLIGGQPTEVMWDGEAPGLVAGVLQVNAMVPAAASSGAVPIIVRVGNQISQSGVTVWVQ